MTLLAILSRRVAGVAGGLHFGRGGECGGSRGLGGLGGLGGFHGGGSFLLRALRGAFFKLRRFALQERFLPRGDDLFIDRRLGAQFVQRFLTRLGGAGQSVLERGIVI